MALTHKQKAFIEAYLRTWNATAAAIEAGYSEKTAYAIGSENLKKPEIDAEIQARLDAQVMSANEVLDRLSRQARFDLGQYIKNNAVDLKALIEDGFGHLIKGIKPGKEGDTIEFFSAFDALQLIGKHHKIFVERQELTGKDGGPIEVNNSGGITDEQRAEGLIALANRIRARTD